MAVPRPPLNLWGVPAAVLLVTVASSLVTGEGAISTTSGTYRVTTDLDPAFVIYLFGVPIATALTAIVAYFSIRPLGARGPLLGPILGVAIGLVTSAVIGTQYQMAQTWWLDNVPTDTNLAAALVAAWIVGFTSVTLVLSAAALARPAPGYRPRNRILGLTVFSGSVGGLVGMFAGGLAAISVAAMHPSYGPGLSDDATGGVILGLLIGSVVGVLVGWAAATASVLVDPSPRVPRDPEP